MELNETREIEVFWAEDLTSCPCHSVLISRKDEIEHFPENRLRAKIYVPGDWESPIGIILFEDGGKWFYNCDYYDDPRQAYELKKLVGHDSLVFFIHDGSEALHIHCKK